MIITDKRISEFINKSLLTDKIENSELKNQNSSIRAIGRTTPNTRNKVSKNIKVYLKWFPKFILLKKGRYFCLPFQIKSTSFPTFLGEDLYIKL